MPVNLTPALKISWLENIGGDSKYSKVVMCPDGCVLFRLTAKPLGNRNFFKVWNENRE